MRVLSVLLFVATVQAQDKPLSAFLFKENQSVKHSISLDQVKQGTPKENPRDAIPAIKKPKHATADKAPWVLDEHRVIGMTINGESRAYPLYILEAHELVDDVLGGVPIAPNY